MFRPRAPPLETEDPSESTYPERVRVVDERRHAAVGRGGAAAEATGVPHSSVPSTAGLQSAHDAARSAYHAGDISSDR
jgi:hypothetical protein